MTQEQILFFEESYTKYYRMMVQTVLPIVGSRDIAEDIVADTFLILLAKINSVMEHEQPVKWLFRVLKNNAISEYRAQCRHAAAPLEESILRAAEPELIPFSGMLPKGLSASEQRILTLRLAEDMDYSTISEKLGISETACRSQYSRAPGGTAPNLWKGVTTMQDSKQIDELFR